MDSVLDVGTISEDSAGFEDVTNLFANAAQDMDQETMYFMEGFTLMDAMGAFEIGEPRLDTGYIDSERQPPPFDPLAPLLPEEVCWILDRALAYEMEWHSGNMLAHTVFTLAYIFHLPEIETGSMIPAFLSECDPKRPIELITGVLGPCVEGLLKCVDLAGRELHNNESIQDSEDWQSDRCEVPIMENVSAPFVLDRLENAGNYVANSPKIAEEWRQALLCRVILRKVWLQLLYTDVCKYDEQYQFLIDCARTCVDSISSQKPFDLAPNSPARLAFDPYISRRLNTSVPVRVITLGAEEETWCKVRTMIDSLEEVKSLVLCHNPTTWEVVGKLRLWLNDAPRPAYARSLAQTSFYNDLLVLNQYTFAWALDKLFEEATGSTWTHISAAVKEAWKMPIPPPLSQIERRLYKLTIHRIKSLWLNPPRRRRYLMKAVVEWHEVYDLCTNMVNCFDEESSIQNHIASQLPQIILSFRLEDICEIMLSGFQLDLYAPPERPHAYWYTAKVIQAHVECYDILLPFLEEQKSSPTGSKPHEEMVFRQRVLIALSDLAKAVFLVTIPIVPVYWEEVLPTFLKRYKWAYRPEYQMTKAAPVAQPDLYEFMRAIDDEALPPAEHVQFAKSSLKELLAAKTWGGWSAQWEPERRRFLQGLLGVCEQLSGLPRSLNDLGFFDPKRGLKWDPVSGHPWFPAAVSLRSKIEPTSGVNRAQQTGSDDAV